MVIKTIFVCIIFCVVSALYFSLYLFNLNICFFLISQHCLLVVHHFHLIFFCAIFFSQQQKKVKQIGNSIYLTILNLLFLCIVFHTVRIHCTFDFDDDDQKCNGISPSSCRKKKPESRYFFYCLLITWFFHSFP